MSSQQDHMDKLLLNDPNVINLIVRSLVGEIAPENSYTVAQTEWTDTKGEFTVYIPQNAEDDRFIPVLIAIQEEVNHASMLKIIEYCTRIYEEFRLLPTVLIISIKGWSSLEDREGFSVDDDSFLGQLKYATNVSVPAFIKLCQFMSNFKQNVLFFVQF
ncbi:hypothetical protein INT47_003804 [Mucor saturninus]|uniref:Uncharacterized protein n=1 Tax=Mucor saturninus TaxID=64648 RepID=A0A8H7R924_9FUNG|nr:hypothetical protein INT47_003804 [Mucor saturninus]